MRGVRWHGARAVSGLCYSVFSEHKSNRARVMHLVQAFRPQPYTESARANGIDTVVPHRSACCLDTHTERVLDISPFCLRVTNHLEVERPPLVIRKTGSRTASDIDMTAIVPSLVIYEIKIDSIDWLAVELKSELLVNLVWYMARTCYLFKQDKKRQDHRHRYEFVWQSPYRKLQFNNFTCH